MCPANLAAPAQRSVMMFVLAVTLVFPALSSRVAALPPGASARGFVEGANHHLGDTSFIARFGRPPGPGDSEALRMHTHLVFVRDWLAARPPTKPELASRRALILTHLDAYIAKGITPENRHLPWRNPVFVDDAGNVCAVGALIEASHPEGHALVQRIAARHRHDYLEDIDMAEVLAWVEGSGFTLTELASIQPGYMGPPVNNYQAAWDRDAPPPDGPWSENGVSGELRKGQMDGAWLAKDDEGRTRGHGDFTAGRGTWTSLHPNGAVHAKGPFSGSRPSGTWTFWYESGRIAAHGTFRRGDRDGAWTLYRDTASHPVLARGAFVEGQPRGRWRHYDERGALVATASSTLRDYDITWRLVAPRTGGVELRVDQGTFMAEYARLDRLIGRFGAESTTVYRTPVFAEDGTESLALFDAAGRSLARAPGGWIQSGCPWPRAALGAARAGRPDTLSKVLDSAEGLSECAPTAVSSSQGQALDALLGTADDPRPWPPLVTALIDTSRWYAEWEHVDALFVAVYDTLPDRVPFPQD